MTDMDITSALDLYDSDRLKISRVAQRLAEGIKRTGDLEDFRQEIIGRFAEAGYVATVNVWEVYKELEGEEGETVDHYRWQIDIPARTEAANGGEFDHDQQRHEVRSNIIGKKDEEASQPVQVGGFTRTKGGLYVP